MRVDDHEFPHPGARDRQSEFCPGLNQRRRRQGQGAGHPQMHLRMPGTLTLPAATLIEAWTELGLSVARAGVRKLVIVNSHGGNDEVMGIVARELRVRADMLVVKSAWSRLGKPVGLYSERELKF